MTDPFKPLQLQCGHCLFYEPEEEACRRYAPRPNTEVGLTLWPRVYADDWCGDFQTDPEFL